MAAGIHPQDFPPEATEALRRPEGTLVFTYESEQLFDRSAGHGILLQIPSGPYLLRLERDANLVLRFLHASPGSGTRLAEVDITPLDGPDPLLVCLAWSPEETRLHVGRPGDPSSILVGHGERTTQRFQITRRMDSSGCPEILQVGDHGLDVLGFRVYEGAAPIVEPPAIEAWREIAKAVEMLGGAESKEGFIFEVVQTNTTLVMLVTGLEAYSQKRFGELDEEGINLDLESLAGASRLSKTVERLGGVDGIVRDAEAAGTSPGVLLSGRTGFNFQDYEQCKAAYRAGYGINFADDLRLDSDDLRRLKRAIGYRHQIIHVSPLNGMLSPPEKPGEVPVFANREFAIEAISLFSRFTEGLHDATLKLRPGGPDATTRTN
jgi:hypothetical protein